MALERRRLVVGNWKMNASLTANTALLQQLAQADLTGASCDVAVCVPFPYLSQVQLALTETTLTWGAQDVSAFDKGAYTGQVSASMLKDFHCTWVLVGHSERRQYQHESHDEIAQKLVQALKLGIRPILCLGETQSQYEQGKTLSTIEHQLESLLAVDPSLRSNVVIAYEPVWAIGTGLTATPEQAQAVHEFIRRKVGDNLILYGGSVKPQNASTLFNMPDIDGALVGGASLSANDFLGIIHASHME